MVNGRLKGRADAHKFKETKPVKNLVFLPGKPAGPNKKLNSLKEYKDKIYPLLSILYHFLSSNRLSKLH